MELLQELRAQPANHEVLGELMPLVTERTVWLSSRVSEALSRRYLEPDGHDDERQPDRAHADLLNEVLSGIADSQTLDHHIRALGFAPGCSYAVLALGANTRPADEAPSVLAAASRLRPLLQAPTRHLILALRSEALIVVCGLHPDESHADFVQAFEVALSSINASSHEDVIGGVGGMERGPFGISVSFRQAKRALEVRRSLQGLPIALRYEESLAYSLVAANPAIRQELVQLLGPLALAPSSPAAEDLLRPLAVFLAVGGNSLEAARILNMSRRTLYRRLRQITALTGWDLEDGSTRTVLDLALRALRLDKQAPDRLPAPTSRSTIRLDEVSKG